jgi:hypothetical protein
VFVENKNKNKNKINSRAPDDLRIRRNSETIFIRLQTEPEVKEQPCRPKIQDIMSGVSPKLHKGSSDPILPAAWS